MGKARFTKEKKLKLELKSKGVRWDPGVQRYEVIYQPGGPALYFDQFNDAAAAFALKQKADRAESRR